MISRISSYTITMRVQGPSRIGSIHEILGAIADTGGLMGAIDTVRHTLGGWIRDFTVHCGDPEHENRISAAVEALDGIHVIAVSDETFRMHLGGKLTIQPKFELKTRAHLSMAYTPGVGRVCSYIAKDPARAWALTIKKNTVAVVSDGSAVLGLGNLGPEGAMPVMEGKAMLFKEFGGVDAFPLCINESDPDAIIRFCEQIAPTFGGINLEDISAPRCFYIEEQLRKSVDIPVFHDDQHGTAIVVLAALKNALTLVGKPISDATVVVLGVGAAGMACSKMMLAAGVGDVIGLDRKGILFEGRNTGDNVSKQWFARYTNKENRQGNLQDALTGADVFVGVSGPGLLKKEWIPLMNSDPIIFALANPIPEIMPAEAAQFAAIVATGRSDYPNQINNVLCFPGIFRGALDSHATDINEEMKLAAARAISDSVPDDELTADYIIPSVFDKDVAVRVASAVADAARASGVAHCRSPLPTELPEI